MKKGISKATVLCSKGNKKYIGSTGVSFKVRYNQHKYSLGSDKSSQTTNGKLDNESLNFDNVSSYSDKRSVNSNPINYRVSNEIKAFKLENETLVDTGLKWKTSKLKIRGGEINNWYSLISTHFVQNIKLN